VLQLRLIRTFHPNSAHNRWHKEVKAMTMTALERTEFVNAYTRALITAWSSEDFSQRLAQDPKAALTEVGLNIPASAEVELIRTTPADTGGEADIDIHVALWESALSTGHYELHIPETPQIDMAELIEGDLGAIVDVTAPTYCCCCPGSCCCCA
jgi:hypothetical protein